MSYARMDHAKWIETHNVQHNRREQGKKRGKFKRPLPEKLTPFQARVIDIVGMVGGGIYNAPISPDRINYELGHSMSLTWGHDLCSYDRGDLTLLVLLCHEARIRVEISPASNRHLRLSFWQRKHTGNLYERHPNIDGAVEHFRAYLPADHRILYKGPDAA